MKLLNQFFATITIVLLLSNCQQAPKQPATTEPVKPDPTQIRADIVAIEKSWANALNARDMNALMALYADDAVSMPNDAPILVGKAAIRQFQEKEWADNPGKLTYSFETTDVFFEGNQVLEIGKTILTNAEGKSENAGKYMSLFEKRNGNYVCIREIYNNDKKQ